LGGLAGVILGERSGSLPEAVGALHKLPAIGPDGKSHILNNPVALHGMDYVIRGLEKEKADDQHTLRGALGSGR